MPKDISQLPKFLSDFGSGVVEILQDTAGNVRRRMSEPGKTRGPGQKVDWDSERQRVAYFASDGFGAGIPYNRTGAYQYSWTVNPNEAGAILFAPHPAAAIGGFPGGWQSRIHRNRWNNITKVLFDELSKIPQSVSNLFKVISR